MRRLLFALILWFTGALPGCLQVVYAYDGHFTLAAESKVLVIGENMSQRVIPYAEKIGAEIYPGIPGYKAGMQAEALLDNGLYIEKAKALDYRIIDIGPDFARRAATGTASEGYQLERFLTKDYAGYEKAFSR